MPKHLKKSSILMACIHVYTLNECINLKQQLNKLHIFDVSIFLKKHKMFEP